MQRKLGPLWRGDSISNRRTPSSCRAAKPRTPSSTKLNQAPPLGTEETVYLIMDWTKPLRSELGKENLDDVNGGRASEWAPGLGVVQVLQRLTFWENCKPPSLEPMSKHRVQENAQFNATQYFKTTALKGYASFKWETEASSSVGIRRRCHLPLMTRVLKGMCHPSNTQPGQDQVHIRHLFQPIYIYSREQQSDWDQSIT